MFLERLRELSNVIIELDKTIGFRKVVKYVALCLFVIGIFNIKTITKTCIEFVNSVQEEIHNDKMIKRDELLLELEHKLSTLREVTDADRVLYFEYHNSKENLVGIPFKYIDLIKQCNKYGVSSAPMSSFKDINVGVMTDLYEEIKYKNNIVYLSSCDTTNNFVQIRELFEEGDGSKQQLFISIPGVNQPLGMIVLEWMREGERTDRDITKKHLRNYSWEIHDVILLKQ